MQSPVLRPLWLRLLIVAACLVWAVVELRGGNRFWAALFGSAGLYLAYQLLLVFNPVESETKEKE